MMVQIQERKAGQSYEVTYDCGDNILKIVRIKIKGPFGKPQSVLEIQRTGLEFRLENIEFEGGLAQTYRTIHRTGDEMVPFLDDPGTKGVLDEIIPRYASEFREIFHLNSQLKGYLNSEFPQIEKKMR